VFNKISDYKNFFAFHRIPMVALIERQDFVRLKEEFDNFVRKPADAGRLLNEEERKKGMALTDILMTDKEEIAAKILRVNLESLIVKVNIILDLLCPIRVIPYDVFIL
jgi:hypothetical protein